MPERDGLNRRSFLKQTGLALSAGAAVSTISRDAAAAENGPGRFRKAVMYGMIQENLSLADKFKMVKDIGFDGIEMNAPGDLDRAEVIRARDASGLVIHGVVMSTHWNEPLTDPDPEVRARSVKALRQAIEDAKAWGATSVLLVPGVVNKEVSYDVAYRRSQAEIRKAVDLAERLEVRILIENVWNNFLLSPLEAARYVDEFNSPMVDWYFDIGNIVRIGWPEHWIRILRGRIHRLHIKEYSREKQRNEGLWKGFEVELLEGDCDWPAVMKALREIDYRGWATAEVPGGDRNRLAGIAERMDRIFAS